MGSGTHIHYRSLTICKIKKSPKIMNITKCFIIYSILKSSTIYKITERPTVLNITKNVYFSTLHKKLTISNNLWKVLEFATLQKKNYNLQQIQSNLP